MAQAQSSPAHATDLSATSARQGRMGRDVFWVLVISVVLAVAALAAGWIYSASQLSASDADNGAQPAGFNAPPSEPVGRAPPPVLR